MLDDAIVGVCRDTRARAAELRAWAQAVCDTSRDIGTDVRPSMRSLDRPSAELLLDTRPEVQAKALEASQGSDAVLLHRR